jgi:hypothetical protein
MGVLIIVREDLPSLSPLFYLITELIAHPQLCIRCLHSVEGEL